MNETCSQHQHIDDTLNRLVKNTDQIIDGLFGALDKPGEGFIAKTNRDIQDLQRSMNTITRVFWLVSGAAIVALVNSIWKVI